MFSNISHHDDWESDTPLSRQKKRDFDIFDETLFPEVEKLFPPGYFDEERQSLLKLQLRPIVGFLRQASATCVSGSPFTATEVPDQRAQEAREVAQRFAEFIRKVEGEMAQLETAVESLPDSEKRFRSGWRNRVRTAAYLAFFSHYGVMRVGEKDHLGHPLTYIEHPFRAAFDVMVHKAGLIDEETFIAELLHDVKEDNAKGMLVARAKGRPKHILRLSEDFVGSRHIQVKDSEAVDINRLMDLVNKERASLLMGRKVNRTEALMCFASEIASLDDYDFLKYGVRAEHMKLCDRMDNGESIGSFQDREKFAAIWLETCYAYLPKAREFGMTNVMEWLYDLLQRTKAEERFKYLYRRREEELIHELPDKFMDRFREALGAYEIAPEEVKVMFRPRGIRHMSPAEIAREEGSPYSHGLQFNNFINFIPNSSDPKRNTYIAQKVRGIINQMFPYRADGRFGEQQTDFGRKYMYRTDVDGHDEVQEMDKFGAGAFRVFADFSDFSRQFYGNVHCALLLNDESSKKALLNYRDRLRSAANLVGVLKHIDSISARDSIDTISGPVRNFIADFIDTVSKKRLLTREERDLLRKNAYAAFFLIVQGKEQVRLIDKGKKGPEVFVPAFGPKGMPMITAFVTGDVQALVCKPLSASVETQSTSLAVINASRVDDFSQISEKDQWGKDTPFGFPMSTQVIRYEVDRDTPDTVLGEYCLASLNDGLMHQLEVTRRKGAIRDLPRDVLQIRVIYDYAT